MRPIKLSNRLTSTCYEQEVQNKTECESHRSSQYHSEEPKLFSEIQGLGSTLSIHFCLLHTQLFHSHRDKCLICEAHCPAETEKSPNTYNKVSVKPTVLWKGGTQVISFARIWEHFSLVSIKTPRKQQPKQGILELRRRSPAFHVFTIQMVEPMAQGVTQKTWKAQFQVGEREGVSRRHQPHKRNP